MNKLCVTLIGSLLFGMGACSTSGGAGKGDSETHWLHECRSSADCGTTGSCLCGFCTVSCASTDDCAGGPGGSCVAQADTASCSSATPSSGGVCIFRCEGDADCTSNQRCSSHVCVASNTPATVSPQDASFGKTPNTDAGTAKFELGGRPDLPSIAYAVSRDGKVVVGSAVTGYSTSPIPNEPVVEPMLWRAGTSATTLACPGSPPCTAGNCGEALGANYDGSVVVGHCSDQAVGADRAFRTQRDGIDMFGPAGSIAYGVNTDGTVIVGTFLSGTANDAGVFSQQPFRWTKFGFGGLGGFPDSNKSIARSVSGDGSTVIGVYTDASDQAHSFVWTAAGGRTQIPDGSDPFFAVRVSSDGSTVVGSTPIGATVIALGVRLPIGCSRCMAFGTNRDGSIVVGGDADSTPATTSAASAANPSAFIWNSPDTLRDLLTTLKDAGADLGDIDQLDARDVSDDGTVIVGQAHHAGANVWQAFRAVLPE